MTLQQLQYLVALAESNSINQAAQNLFVSQSGISKAIKQLESELGFPLLERSSRGITFTSRGTEFLHDAYSLIKQFHTISANGTSGHDYNVHHLPLLYFCSESSCKNGKSIEGTQLFYPSSGGKSQRYHSGCGSPSESAWLYILL